MLSAYPYTDRLEEGENNWKARDPGKWGKTVSSGQYRIPTFTVAVVCSNKNGGAAKPFGKDK